MSLARLRAALAGRERHLVPFFVLGDPDPETSVALIAASVEAGASQVELGIPFSDPVADGPAIQAAGERARAAGTSVAVALELLAAVRARVDVPLNLLVYGNLAHAPGYRAFARGLAGAGASSLLVPDVPFEEGAPLRRACAEAGLGHVPLLGPRTDTERAQRLARDATGFVYLAGHQGVTGAREESTRDAVRRVTAALAVPVAVGFGLRTPADVAATFAAGARMAVVGSELARCIERHVAHASLPSELTRDVRARVRRLADAAAGPRAVALTRAHAPRRGGPSGKAE